jgi:hypothetical protein
MRNRAANQKLIKLSSRLEALDETALRKQCSSFRKGENGMIKRTSDMIVDSLDISIDTTVFSHERDIGIDTK